MLEFEEENNISDMLKHLKDLEKSLKFPNTGNYIFHNHILDFHPYLRAKHFGDISQYENNPYGYYGILNSSTGKFYIREVLSGEQKKSSDRRRITLGKECSSWQKSDLLKIALRIGLKVGACNLPRVNMIKFIKEKDGTFSVDELNDMNAEELCIVFFLSSKNKRDICGLLRAWFTENNLLLTR